jgi:hypothetical protein
MKTQRALLAITVLSILVGVACDGPKGPSGSSGRRGPGFVWKDAAGNVVEGAIGAPIGAGVEVDYPGSSIGHRFPMRVAFLDSSSDLWLVDPRGGDFYATLQIESGFTGPGRAIWFAGAGCTGETYVIPQDLPLPKSVLRILPLNPGAPPFFAAAPDDSAAQPATVASLLLGTSCVLTGSTLPAAFSETALEALPAITPPPTPIVPLHIERD